MPFRPILGGSFALLLASVVAAARADAPPEPEGASELPISGPDAEEPSASLGDETSSPDGDVGDVARSAKTHAPPVASKAVADADPVSLLTWSQEPVDEGGLLESPELRALRIAEEELFRERAAEEARAAAVDEPYVAEAPPKEVELNGKRVNLAFLKNLKLPNIPVRWDRRVLEYLVFFKDDPRGRELAGAWVKRSERYGAMIRRTLAEHTLPSDLQYVAMIESGYDPRARSNVDAFGMWQFVEQPAVSYGLRVDHWVDERLDPERSTRAAARFLRDLHERFGTWELAFAAYNMGYGGLLRSIRKYNTNDYWELARLEAGLPFETSLYVAKIMAMAIVANNPRAFGFGELGREAPLALGKIDVPAGALLSEVAEAAGVTVEQLKRVNPQLKRGRVPPGEGARLFVPKGAELRFAQRWKPSSATLASHVLRQGETLEELAKRLGVSAQKLRELNELDSDARPLPGVALFVPSGARPTSDLVEPLVAAVPDREFHYEGRERLFYRVAQGDTPSSVARAFDVTLDELRSWNQLSDRAALQSGMLLQLFVVPEVDLSRVVVYRPEEVRVLTVGSDAFFEHHETQRGRVRVRYRVQPKDTMSELASRFDLSVGSIARINQFSSQRELVANEWLTLYVPEAQLAKLEAQGIAERIGGAALASAPSQPRAKAKDEELPEEEGAPLMKPRPEAPLSPPKKTRALAPAQPPGKVLGERPAKVAPRGK